MAKHLFSPWRSAYIESFATKQKKKSCLFCEIKNTPRSDEKNLIVYRGTYCFVVMNKFPYNSGHLMVVPYRHTAKLHNLKKAEYEEIMSLLIRCTDALSEVSNPDGFNIGANIGKVAGAGIDKHIHFHIVPRWNGDVNFMPVLSDVKVVSQSLPKIANSLRKILNNTED